MSADPIGLALAHHRLAAIAEEMGVVLGRTALSPNIKERRDYSCAVFDRDAYARLSSANCSTPIFFEGHVFAASGYGNGGNQLGLDGRGSSRKVRRWGSPSRCQPTGGRRVRARALVTAPAAPPRLRVAPPNAVELLEKFAQSVLGHARAVIADGDDCFINARQPAGSEYYFDCHSTSSEPDCVAKNVFDRAPQEI
jgi:hypothetical protein